MDQSNMFDDMLKKAGIQEKFEANLKETFYCVLKYTVLAVYVNHIWL
jgi:hypothetical protein